MERNKIEKQLREKLDTREIQPSSQAWDRLDAMLSVAEEKKTRRSFGWLYIAAGILVFISLGTFFYNQENTNRGSNEVVVTEEGIKKETNTNSDSVIDKVDEITSSDETTPQLAQSTESNKGNNNQKTTPNKNTTFNNQKATIQPEAQPNWTQSNEIINQKQQAITATNPNQEEKIVPKVITVQPELLASNEIRPASRVKVNANSLLAEVDGETELTFRGKVFKKVSRNYKEVKEAIATRNLDE